MSSGVKKRLWLSSACRHIELITKKCGWNEPMAVLAKSQRSLWVSYKYQHVLARWLLHKRIKRLMSRVGQMLAIRQVWAEWGWAGERGKACGKENTSNMYMWSQCSEFSKHSGLKNRPARITHIFNMFSISATLDRWDQNPWASPDF